MFNYLNWILYFIEYLMVFWGFFFSYQLGTDIEAKFFSQKKKSLHKYPSLCLICPVE